jgi:gamma-glutamylcyclotransferase (GGCT)/AIG2-like uncharacterized protein YtfP
MKFKKFLKEEYVGSFETNNMKFMQDYTEVFKNPTFKEILEVSEPSPMFHGIGKAVRFICDFKNENLFVTKPTIFHVHTAEYLFDKGEIEYRYTDGGTNTSIIWGEAEVKNGRLHFLDSGDGVDIAALKKYDDSWTSRWFKPSLLQSIKMGSGVVQNMHIMDETTYFKKIKSGDSVFMKDSKPVTVIINPEPNEIRNGTKYNYIADLEDKKLYIWAENHVLWNDVGSKIIKDWNEDNIERFVYGEVVAENNKLRIHPTSLERKIFAKQPWIKKYFLFRLSEEYLTMARSKYIDGIVCEIYKNPTWSELKTLDKEFRKEYADLFRFKENKKMETIRFIFDLKGNWWASIAILLHSEIAMYAKKHMFDIIEAYGRIDGNTLYVDAGKNEEYKNIVNDTLKKTNINYKIKGL